MSIGFFFPCSSEIQEKQNQTSNVPQLSNCPALPSVFLKKFHQFSNISTFPTAHPQISVPDLRLVPRPAATARRSSDAPEPHRRDAPEPAEPGRKGPRHRPSEARWCHPLSHKWVCLKIVYPIFQWFCWSLSLLNGYFIGGIHHFQTYPNGEWHQQKYVAVDLSIQKLWWFFGTFTGNKRWILAKLEIFCPGLQNIWALENQINHTVKHQ